MFTSIHYGLRFVLLYLFKKNHIVSVKINVSLTSQNFSDSGGIFFPPIKSVGWRTDSSDREASDRTRKHKGSTRVEVPGVLVLLLM